MFPARVNLRLSSDTLLLAAKCQLNNDVLTEVAPYQNVQRLEYFNKAITIRSESYRQDTPYPILPPTLACLSKCASYCLRTEISRPLLYT